MEHGTHNHEGTACVTCGSELHGMYCSHCGEKRLEDHDKSVIHYLGELLHSLSHADSKFLRSLRYLVTRPGFLTREFVAGRRKPYTNMLSLFLIGNLLYLLFPPNDALNSNFISQTDGQPYSEMIAIPQARQKMEVRHWNETQIAARYNEESAHNAKMMLIVLVFLFS